VTLNEQKVVTACSAFYLKTKKQNKNFEGSFYHAFTFIAVGGKNSLGGGEQNLHEYFFTCPNMT